LKRARVKGAAVETEEKRTKPVKRGWKGENKKTEFPIQSETSSLQNPARRESPAKRGKAYRARNAQVPGPKEEAIATRFKTWKSV